MEWQIQIGQKARGDFNRIVEKSGRGLKKRKGVELENCGKNGRNWENGGAVENVERLEIERNGRMLGWENWKH